MKNIPIGAFVDTELGMKLSNSAEKNGRLYNARPIPVHSFILRFNLAWAVFTGKADALYWAIDLTD